MSRCRSMTGMSERISPVTSAQREPGPNANGWGVSARNGVARSAMDVTWASSIICDRNKVRSEQWSIARLRE